VFIHRYRFHGQYVWGLGVIVSSTGRKYLSHSKILAITLNTCEEAEVVIGQGTNNVKIKMNAIELFIYFRPRVIHLVFTFTYIFMIGFGWKPNTNTDKIVTLCPGIAGTLSPVPSPIEPSGGKEEERKAKSHFGTAPSGRFTSIIPLW
jgi:hypothetical protein